MVSNSVMLLLGLAVGIVLEYVVLRLVHRPALLANPVARSSHTTPTPTMGGVVIVLVVLAYFAFVLQSEMQVGMQFGWGLFIALAAIALIGLWDDLHNLSARFRLPIHFLAAGMVLWALDLTLAWPILVILLIGLVWLINLYNFMDGIDGIAAAQCLVFCLGVVFISGGIPGWAGDFVWLLAGVTTAFMAFNWPPAKIFMGDVGSGFLGILLGMLTLYLWQIDSVPLVTSLILLTVFWFDATYTLCVRIATGQNFVQAHRQHLYQHLAVRKGHLWTTTIFVIYALMWLLPLAWYASLSSNNLLAQCVALLLAALPMAIMCVRCRAGVLHTDTVQAGEMNKPDKINKSDEMNKER